MPLVRHPPLRERIDSDIFQKINCFQARVNYFLPISIQYLHFILLYIVKKRYSEKCHGGKKCRLFFKSFDTLTNNSTCSVYYDFLEIQSSSRFQFRPELGTRSFFPGSLWKSDVPSYEYRLRATFNTVNKGDRTPLSPKRIHTKRPLQNATSSLRWQ